MANKIKKVDVKKEAKKSFSKQLLDYLTTNGQKVDTGDKYGFTEGTLVLHTEKCDIQIKLITPKAGLEKYEEVEEE